ncbi:MAG: flagellin [Rhodospirillaceae bacterium]|nr:flagellin [Rhodospirillales bacterium]
MDSVTLSSAVRTNLLSLQKTGDYVNRTNNRLSTGLRVSSAIDDAVNYFQAKALSDRAGDLGAKKEAVDQAVSAVKGAMGGLESVEKILSQMKGVALSAKSASDVDRVELASQFNSLATQINNLVNDTTYQGLNLIGGTAASLKVEFSEKTSAVLTIKGVDVKTAKLKGFAVAASVAATATAGKKWSTVSSAVSSLDAVVKALDSAIATVRSNVKALGGNVALLQTRLDFTKNYVNTLKEGSEKLTLADLNEEGANLVSLQTRQQLGIQALSFAGQQEQGVLSLLQ